MEERSSEPAKVWSLSRMEWRQTRNNGEIVLRLWDSQRWETREHTLSWGNVQVWGGPLDPTLQNEAPILLITSETSFPVMPLQLREQASYRLEVLWEGAPQPPSLDCFPALSPPLLRSDPGWHRPYVYSGTLNFRDYVGETALVLRGEEDILRVVLEVRSRKIGYLDDYVMLLNDLGRRLASLLLRLDSPVYASFQPGLQPSLGVGDEQFLLLRHLVRWPELRHSWDALLRQPPEVLTRTPRRVRTAQRQPRTSMELAAGYRSPNSWIRAPGSLPLPEAAQGRLPATFPHQALTLQRDPVILEFALSLHERVASMLSELRGRYERARRSSLVLEVERLQEEWSRLPTRPMLLRRGRSAYRVPRQKLAHHPRLVLLLEAWDLLDLSLRLSWKGLADVILGPLRDLATLYEYWCFFALMEALSEVGQPHPSTPPWWSLDGARLQADLSRNEGFGFHVHGLDVWLFYQRRFSPGDGVMRSYSVPLVPDYSLEVRRAGKPPVLLCFDAKYRPDQSLEKMHAYRDALRGALGCYVLYPGEESEPTIFPVQPGSWLPGVGAFSLRPSNQSQAWLVHFLRWAMEQLAKEDEGLFLRAEA